MFDKIKDFFYNLACSRYKKQAEQEDNKLRDYPEYKIVRSQILILNGPLVTEYHIYKRTAVATPFGVKDYWEKQRTGTFTNLESAEKLIKGRLDHAKYVRENKEESRTYYYSEISKFSWESNDK